VSQSRTVSDVGRSIWCRRDHCPIRYGERASGWVAHWYRRADCRPLSASSERSGHPGATHAVSWTHVKRKAGDGVVLVKGMHCMKRANLVLMAVIVLIGAVPASAHTSSSSSKHNYQSQTISVTGGWANCDLTSWKNTSYLTRDNIVDLYCTIADTQSTDSIGIYVSWRYDGYASIKSPTYTSGTNNIYNPSAYGGGDSIAKVYFRVCRAKPWLPDTCSSEKSWSVLH
jgi:hypothetical protein